MEELIHVRFDDKLDHENLNLVKKFAYLEVTYLGSGDKDSDVKESKTKDSEGAPSKVVKVLTPLRKHK